MHGGTLPFDSVLIVDDDPLICAIAEAAFRQGGIPIVAKAANGQEAIRYLKDHPNTAFVLLDLNMPNMDGLQFLRHLADQAFKGEVGIVSGEDASIVKSARMMAEKYGLSVRCTMQKPIDIDSVTAFALKDGAMVQNATASSPAFTRNDLVFALVNRDIKPVFQPKICAHSGDLFGAEALARWTHPDLGPIPPVSFIPVAEQEGLIDALTGAIVRETFVALARWSTYHPSMKMAVNLSGDVLTNVELPELMQSLCKECAVEPAQVIFEVTESRIINDSALPIEILARLRMNRFELSVDDFGTGYSNIDRLREFPFNELKIDQGFVRDAAQDAFAEKCVRPASISDVRSGCAWWPKAWRPRTSTITCARSISISFRATTSPNR
ncbi:MAG: EAL domain-containing response regulator [Pseudomonadota bacterium]